MANKLCASTGESERCNDKIIADNTSATIKVLGAIVNWHSGFVEPYGHVEQVTCFNNFKRKEEINANLFI